MADEDEVYEPKKKVFIANCSGYVGKNLSSRFAAEGYEVVGTVAAQGLKPLSVSRVVDNTPEALAAAFLESEMTVLDCLGDMAVSETILEVVSTSGPLETSKVLVGVSSVMTWARTSPDPDDIERPLTEADYKKRRPHGSYNALVQLERLITKSKRDGLRTHVVAAGLTYGEEEDLFHPLFKAAWSNLALPLNTMADGSNILPTIHVADLCSVVVKLLDNEAVQYLLAIDKPSDEGKPQTLRRIVQALSAELGTGEILDPPTRDALHLIKDYDFFQLGAPIGDTPGLKLQAAAINDLGIEWHAEGGLLANVPTVVEEYRNARGLQPLCLLVHGNCEFAISELAAALAAEYKLPHIVASDALDEAAQADEALSSELQTAKASGSIPAELSAKALRGKLTSTVCRNTGYILEGFPMNLADASLLFAGESVDATDAVDEGADDAEKEEKASAPALPGAPEFIITLEAHESVLKAKLLEQTEPAMTEEKLSEMLATYAETNADDSQTSILSHPALSSIEQLGPLAVPIDFSVDGVLSKARIYLGQPRNYGPTEEEIAAKKALEEAEAKRKAEEEAAAAAQRVQAEADERARREEQEASRRAGVKQQEAQLLEVRSVPLRNYLMTNVIPTLTEGLIEVCKLKPDDPVDYLAEYLFKNNPEDE